MGSINHPARQPVPPAAVSRVLSRFTRAELEGFVEVAIGLMDVADGDPDLEEDDPSGDPLEIHGEMPSDTGAPIYRTPPRYGPDQTKGPINKAQAHRQYLHDRGVR